MRIVSQKRQPDKLQELKNRIAAVPLDQEIMCVEMTQSELMSLLRAENSKLSRRHRLDHGRLERELGVHVRLVNDSTD